MHAVLEAFELAWAEITAQPDGYDHGLARDLLARRIIEAAIENGERDPERLKAYAGGAQAVAGLALRLPARLRVRKLVQQVTEPVRHRFLRHLVEPWVAENWLDDWWRKRIAAVFEFPGIAPDRGPGQA